MPTEDLESLLQEKLPMYPYQRKIKGLIVISMVINCKGETGSCKVLQNDMGGYDREIIKLLKKHAKWTPAQKKGRDVDVAYNFVIRVKKGKYQVLWKK